MGVLSDRQIETLAASGMIVPYSPMQKRPGVISFGVSSMGYDVRIGYKFKVFKIYPHDEIDPKAFNPDLLEDVDLTPVVGSDGLPRHRFDLDNLRSKEEVVCAHCGESARLLPPLNPIPAICPKPPANYILIPPHSFALGESIEWFNIPRDILIVCLGKSTYARCGLIVNVTPGEPEWPGHWTIEMSNTTPLPIRVYAGEGIMQCLFFRSDERSTVTEQAVTSLMWGQHDEQQKYLAALEQAGCGVSYKDKKGKYTDQLGLTLPKVD